MKKAPFLITISVMLMSCNSNTYNNLADSLKLDSVKIDTTTHTNNNLGSNANKSTLLLLNNIQIDPNTFKKVYENSRMEGDEFSKSKFLFDKGSPKYVDVSGVFCYLNVNSINPILHFKIQYTAEDWLFIKTMTFNIDGDNIDYTPLEFKTDNGNGHIWEWSDENIEESDLPLLVKLALGKKAKVKYFGTQYYKIVNISSKQQLAIQHMLMIYKGLLLGYKK